MTEQQECDSAIPPVQPGEGGAVAADATSCSSCLQKIEIGAHLWKWDCSGSGQPLFHMYNDECQRVLEESYRRGDQFCIVPFTNGKHRVDFSLGVQENTLTGFKRLVHRDSGPPKWPFQRKGNLRANTVRLAVPGIENPTPQLLLPAAQETAGTRGDKLVVVFCGLPARGKTFLARRICTYLRFLHGAPTKIFNTGDYRRKLYGAYQPPSFFDPNNAENMAKRMKCREGTMADLKKWLNKDPPEGEDESSTSGKVAIYDGSNTTKQSRRWVLEQLSVELAQNCHVLFVECLCTDKALLRKHVEMMATYAPDFKDRERNQMIKELEQRTANYELFYVPIEDSSLSYIKVFNGGQSVNINRLHGFLPGRILQLVINIHSIPRPIYLSRHGQSKYNVLKKLGGDSGLSELGSKYAKALGAYVTTHVLGKPDEKVEVWTSTLARTKETAQFIDFTKVHRLKRLRSLDEVYAGIFDGMTYEQVQMTAPDEFALRSKNKLTYRYPRGESYLDVISRLDPVIHEIERRRSPVVIIAHQGILRMLRSYFLDIPREDAPFTKIPLHTLLKVTPHAYFCKEERIDLMGSSLHLHDSPV